MKPRRYATAAAFKAALDQRLRQVASGADITRRRQLLVFDRYLARLGRVLGDAATLKGGLVLEVRLDRARTTRDIDLRLAGAPAGLLERLQEAGRLDLSDFMSFELRADARHPDIAGPGVQYGGRPPGSGPRSCRPSGTDGRMPSRSASPNRRRPGRRRTRRWPTKTRCHGAAWRRSRRRHEPSSIRCW